MKKLIFLFLLLPSVAFSQSAFKGFFRPLQRSYFEVDITTDHDKKSDLSSSLWLVRPKINLTATQVNFTKPVEVTSLTSMGLGVTYAKITSQNGNPYTSFGVSGLILFTDGLGDTEPFRLSTAITVTALNVMDFGAGYSWYLKKPFLLIGIAWNFN